jgi:hypothetical protein
MTTFATELPAMLYFKGRGVHLDPCIERGTPQVEEHVGGVFGGCSLLGPRFRTV